MDGRLRPVAHGAIRTDASRPLYERLHTIYEGLGGVIRDTHPDGAAVESIFTARNVSSALKLGHARGVVLLALVHAGLSVSDYSPSEVKQAVVGTGRADKEQVGLMVRTLLNLPKIPQQDAGDALAVAICHLMHGNLTALGGRL